VIPAHREDGQSRQESKYTRRNVREEVAEVVGESSYIDSREVFFYTERAFYFFWLIFSVGASAGDAQSWAVRRDSDNV
jgi:hypothetical protein